ncbi:MAG: DoxX family protein [Acidimicrobiales bacterium]
MLAVGVIEVARTWATDRQPATWAAVGMVFMMIGAVLYHAKAKHPINSLVPATFYLRSSGIFAALSL